MNNDDQVFLRRAVLVIFAVLAVAAVAALLFRLASIVLIAVTCWILAVALDVPIRRLQAMGVRRWLAMSGVFLAIGVVVGLYSVLVVPPLVTQIADLAADLPETVEDVLGNYDQLRESNQLAGQYLPDLNLDTDLLDPESDSAIVIPEDSALPTINWGAVAEGTVGLISSVGNFIGNLFANLVVIFFVTLFILLDPLVYYRAIVALVPRASEERAVYVLNAVTNNVTAWVGAMALSITATTIIFTVLLLILGIPNALALGTIAGLATLIPIAGPTVALIPIAIFAAAQGLGIFIATVILYASVGIVQDRVITPTVMKNELNIPAAGLILFQLVATILFGFFGLLLAVPVLSILITLVHELFVVDVLGKRDGVPEVYETATSQLRLGSPPEEENGE